VAHFANSGQILKSKFGFQKMTSMTREKLDSPATEMEKTDGLTGCELALEMGNTDDLTGCEPATEMCFVSLDSPSDLC
jgi:hypothetical protein